MDSRYDAIVAGGGPAGAGTAILLAAAGWKVAVVEKASYPRSISFAIGGRQQRHHRARFPRLRRAVDETYP